MLASTLIAALRSRAQAEQKISACKFSTHQLEFQTSLFDMERVEVIKGSQNTLLGKNTILGAISLITKKFGETLSGFIESSYEFEYGSVGTTGAIDLPASASSTGISFNHADEKGFVENLAAGNDLSILGDIYQTTKDELGIISALDPLTELALDQKNHHMFPG